MTTIDRYILRHLIIVTLMGVASLTALMLLGQIFQELQKLLVESGAPPSIVVDFILQVIPFSLTFTLPWGFVTAVLLVYGRLAADNELTSMRMAGLNLWRLSAPAIGLGVVLSALCYYINIEVAPKGKQAMSDIAVEALQENPKSLLSTSQTAVKIDKMNLFIESREGDMIHGLHLFPIAQDESKKKKATPKDTRSDFDAIHAERAIIGDYNSVTRKLHLTLLNTSIERSDGNATDMPFIKSMPLEIFIPIGGQRRLKANRFTNAEIAHTLEIKNRSKLIDVKEMEQYAEQMGKEKPFPAAGLLWRKAHEITRHHKAMSKKTERSFRTEGIQRASFACACIIFALIGVPMAITARRRDTTTGFALGILIAALYFLALVFCELSRKSSGIAPYIILWVPNIIGLIYALWLHKRAKYRG